MYSLEIMYKFVEIEMIFSVVIEWALTQSALYCPVSHRAKIAVPVFKIPKH